jgi:DNA-binding LacI/PurR family transcriptional regulator
MGRAAAELLLRLIAGDEIPSAERILRLEAALRPAESTAPPAGACAQVRPRRNRRLGP